MGIPYEYLLVSRRMYLQCYSDDCFPLACHVGIPTSEQPGCVTLLSSPACGLGGGLPRPPLFLLLLLLLPPLLPLHLPPPPNQRSHRLQSRRKRRSQWRPSQLPPLSPPSQWRRRVRPPVERMPSHLLNLWNKRFATVAIS